MKFKKLLIQILLSCIIVCVFLILISILLKGCHDENHINIDKTTFEPLNLNDKIDIKTMTNTTITLQKTEDGFKYLNDDKVILINFFTTKCAPCNAMIAHLNNLQNRYKNDLTIISVLLEAGLSHEEVELFLKTNHIDYIVTFDRKNLQLSSSYGNITDIPSMFVYDKNGKLLENYVGAVTEEMIEADLIRIF